jgi:hypothetical protein
MQRCGAGSGAGGFAMQYDKNDYRGLLAALEGFNWQKGGRFRGHERQELGVRP